ncbi:MAG: acylneuraminate cytidylyltransferase family protein [Chitinophagaceae bacterium]|nr:acylneuraminate cytidylyltransferase family protein [Chitinophagaceae bacterium]
MLGVIPARGGSKGVPRKNIKLLGGKPLIAYTIEAAKRSKLNKIVVSTEDLEIAEIAKQLGAEVPFMRPDSLSQDSTPTIDVVIHVINELEKIGEEFDYICLLQPTVPFRTKSEIDESIKKIISEKADSLISVRKVPHQFNPHWTFIKKGSGFLKIATNDKSVITQRQLLPEAFYRDGSVYITSTNILIERHSLFGDKLAYLLNESQRFVNIDTLSDWNEAEKIVEG